MITRYTDANYRQLVPRDYQGVLPRRTRYNADDSFELGLLPIEYSSLDVLDYSDLKEAITAAREAQAMPVFFQKDTWAPDGFKSSQDGLSFCWNWSACATFLDLRAIEGKETILVAPSSLGELTSWRDRGFYLGETASYLKKYGVAPISSVDGDFNSTNLNPNSFSDPEWKTTRLDYRLAEILDVDCRNGDKWTVQQIVTLLCASIPCYFAINAFQHAMQLTGVSWDESAYLNVKWDVRNSHGETSTITTEGSRWIADEVIGFASSRLA